jgi:hypothetical protein
VLPGRAAILRAQHSRAQERGGSKLNLLITLLILGGTVFSAYKLVPPYFVNYQFQDSLESEARFAMAGRKTEDDMRDDVWKKMQELGIPGKRDDIRISVVEGVVQISLNYTVPIDLQVYQFNLQFHPHADNHSI